MATIDRYSRIQVLYSDTAGVTPDDGQLYNGEFAWAYGDGGNLKELYIGGGESTDVTFVGAEILRSGDNPFSESGVDNKIATTKAIYDYVDTQLGSAAGVTTVDGVTGAVDLRGGDFISITPGTHPDKGITLSVLDDNVTLGLTLTDKLGVKDSGIGTVQLADSAVTNAKLANSGITLSSGAGISITNSNVDLGETATIAVGVDNTTIETFFSAGNKIRVKASGIDTDQIANDAVTNAKLANSEFTFQGDGAGTVTKNLGETVSINGSGGNISTDADQGIISISLENDVDITGSLTADTAIHTADLYVTNDASIGGTLEVGGNLIVNGNLTTIDVATVSVEDPLIFLASNNSTDNVDIGFVGQSTSSSYTGLIRDAGEDIYYLFTSTTDLSTSNNSFNIDDGNTDLVELRANIVAGTFSA